MLPEHSIIAWVISWHSKFFNKVLKFTFDLFVISSISWGETWSKYEIDTFIVLFSKTNCSAICFSWNWLPGQEYEDSAMISSSDKTGIVVWYWLDDWAKYRLNNLMNLEDYLMNL